MPPVPASITHTNLALVDIDDADVTVGVIRPYDADTHTQLEARHTGTHLVRRHGDRLEIVRLQEDAEDIGDQLETRSVRRLGALLQALIEHSLLRYLASSRTKLAFIRRHPLIFVSLESKNDVAHYLFGRELQRTLPLRVRRGFEVEARPVGVNGKRRIALAIDAHTYTAIEPPCCDLLADGFHLEGLYVKEQVETEDPGILKGLRTVGMVAKVDGRRLILGHDRRDDRTEVPSDQAWLDAHPTAVKRILNHYVRPGAHERLWDERGEIAAGVERLSRLEKLRGRLAQSSIPLIPNACWRINDWLDAPTLRFWSIPAPRFLVGTGQIAESAASVLKSGPRHVPHTLSQRLDACVICERRRQPQVEHFLKDLRDGFRGHRGLKNTWRVSDMRWQVFPAHNADATSYERACRDALDGGNKWGIVFVQVPSSSHDLSGDENPYLVTKAKFLARGIPVQEFTDESLLKTENQRPWVLGGIGLQTFAKLGGTPWLLEAPALQGHEVVLGIGSAQIGSGRFGDRERVVGLTTAFSGDGTYWLAEASRTVPYAEHEAAMGDAAVAAVQRVRETMAWRAGDAVRLVFHSFKPFRGAHVARIHELLRSLGRDGHDVKCAFVHVVEHHPVVLFDPAQAHRIAPRGLAIPLSDYEVLVSVIGPEEVRKERLGFPRPLLLRVHGDSTLDDLEYLARQVAAFSAHSWRNFTPTSLPVTVLYSELIADLLGRLGNLSRWDPDVLRGEVGSTRWFL